MLNDLQCNEMELSVLFSQFDLIVMALDVYWEFQTGTIPSEFIVNIQVVHRNYSSCSLFIFGSSEFLQSFLLLKSNDLYL